MRRGKDPAALGRFLFAALVGALLHFTHAWSGGAPAAGAFSAVNESVWEHMKLLFWPLFFLTGIELLLRRPPDFLAPRAVSAAAGLALLPAAFYTYTGILGRDIPAADIAVFLLADAAVFWLEARLSRQKCLTGRGAQAAGLLAMWALAFLFVLYTFRPPHIPLFRDPLTLGYGPPPAP